MPVTIVYPTTAFLTVWQSANGGISTGVSHPIGQGPFDPDSLPKPLEQPVFLSPARTEWFASQPSPFERAVKIAEGFAHPMVTVGTEAYCTLENLVPALGHREGCRLVGHVIATYLNHSSHEARQWALRFIALCEKSIRGLTPVDFKTLGSAAAMGLKDDHPKVRKLALTVLGVILPRVEPKDRRAIALQMADWLDDDSAEVRWRAVHVVSSAVPSLDRDDQLEPMLRMRARLTDEDPLVAWTAVSAFGEIFRAPEWKDRVEAHFASERKFCEDFLKTKNEERRRYWAEQAAARPHYDYPPEEPQTPRRDGSTAARPMRKPTMTSSLEKALRTLNLDYDAVESHEDVRRAYRRCAAILHPDKNPGADRNLEFAALMRAYHLICTAFGFETVFK
jgi:hypothetical protein